MSNSKSNKCEQPKLKFTGQKPPTKPPAKRFEPDTSNNSNTSMEELSGIHHELEGLSQNVKHLREDLKSMMKKDEIEDLIQNTVTNIMKKLEDSMHKKIAQEVSDKTKELKERIDGLEFENKQLKDKLTSCEKNNKVKLNDFEMLIEKNFKLSHEANQRANYNEQYSRKNNVKIMNIKDEGGETEQKLITVVTDVLRTRANVDLKSEDIIAIHRIPTSRKGESRPVLVKLKNNNAKSNIMRKRKEMKGSGYKLVDDVTKLNQGLINRLYLHEQIKSGWYFNGSVYGLTTRDERVRFDIYDNISEVISEYRNKRVKR